MCQGSLSLLLFLLILDYFFYLKLSINLHQEENHYDDDINLLLDPGTGIRNPKYRWPREGNKILVPFLIDPIAKYSKIEIERIYAAMRHISERTCINFKRRRYEKNFILIYSGNWYSSFIGRVGGEQRLSLEKGSTCANQIGTIIHELVHSLGFAHMQSHAERDRFITIINENIMQGEKYQFEKFNPWEASSFGTPYDYMSIMHYNSHAFSRNGKPTIIVKRNKKFNRVIGQMKSLSFGDVKRIRNMYNCDCIQQRLKSCEKSLTQTY